MNFMTNYIFFIILFNTITYIYLTLDEKKILITGGAGFIGNELIKLIKNKRDIIVVDKKEK